MIPTVQRGLGTKYASTPDELVEANKKVAGPVLAELRTRYNELGPKLGMQHEATAAVIAALDTTGMSPHTEMIDEETGDVYYLDPTGTPGAGDLAASPTGAWYYSRTQ